MSRAKEKELIFIKSVKLSKHHKRVTVYIRDKILDDYEGENAIVKVYV